MSEQNPLQSLTRNSVLRENYKQNPSHERFPPLSSAPKSSSSSAPESSSSSASASSSNASKENPMDKFKPLNLSIDFLHKFEFSISDKLEDILKTIRDAAQGTSQPISPAVAPTIISYNNQG
jgi:hypothetical protein